MAQTLRACGGDWVQDMEGTDSPAPDVEYRLRRGFAGQSSSSGSRDVERVKGTHGQVVFYCVEHVGGDVSKSEGGWTPGACRLRQIPATECRELRGPLHGEAGGDARCRGNGLT
jgi:hypothetical protein